MGETDITIDPDGRVSLANAQAASRLKPHIGRWRVAAQSPDVLLLRRADRRPSGSLSGELTDPSMLIELVQLFANGGWSGEFQHLSRAPTGPVLRSLVFDHGAVIFGSSSHPPERLGEVMYRRGRVSRAELDSIAPSLGHERRIGEVLVERGVLRPTDVFAMLEALVEEVFHNLIRDAAGSFVFTLGFDASALQARVNLPTARLLMESVQRMDEWALLRARIPDARVVPCWTPDAETVRPPSDTITRQLSERIDGQRSLQDLARELGVSDFEATKALHALLSAGGVALRPRQSPREAIEAVAAGFNRVLVDILATVDAVGAGDEARETLALFVDSGGPVGALLDRAPLPDGTLDATALSERAEAAGVSDPPAFVRQCLYDYVTFALFAAGTVVDRETHRQLAQRVQNALGKLKT